MRSKALKGIGKVVLLDKKVRSEVEDPKDEFKLELNKNSEKPIPIFPNTRLILRYCEVQILLWTGCIYIESVSREYIAFLRIPSNI